MPLKLTTVLLVRSAVASIALLALPWAITSTSRAAITWPSSGKVLSQVPLPLVDIASW
ncbi:Uncharacterised protein [Vibrio cholerae]|nr:Uncharacterised protein [Vibrio cholerae]